MEKNDTSFTSTSTLPPSEVLPSSSLGMAGDCPPLTTTIIEQECKLQPSTVGDTIPQLSAEEVQALLDTGYQLGDFTSSISLVEQPLEVSSSECPPDLALAALECSMSSDKKQLFETCFQYGIALEEDALYQTWRSFKTKMINTDTADTDDNILERIPKLQACKSGQSARSTKEGFFVITCDEAYKAKIQKEEEKRKKLEKRKKQV